MKKRIDISIPMDFDAKYTIAELREIGMNPGSVNNIIGSHAHDVTYNALVGYMKPHGVGVHNVRQYTHQYADKVVSVDFMVPNTNLKAHDKTYKGRNSVSIELTIHCEGSGVTTKKNYKNPIVLDYMNKVLIPLLTTFDWVSVYAAAVTNFTTERVFNLAGELATNHIYQKEYALQKITDKLDGAVVTYDDGNLRIVIDLECVDHTTAPTMMKNNIISRYLANAVEQILFEYDYSKSSYFITHPRDIPVYDDYETKLRDSLFQMWESYQNNYRCMTDIALMQHSASHGMPNPEFHYVTFNDGHTIAITGADSYQRLDDQINKYVLNELGMYCGLIDPKWFDQNNKK